MVDLPLTKLAETATTITLGWTPIPCLGYVLYADGVRKSNSWDQAKSSWKTAKATEIKVVALGAEATGVYPFVLPPLGPRLVRPPLVSPVVLTVTNANRIPFQLDNAKDYIVNFGETLTSSLDIRGGRNVVVTGGRISINASGESFANTGLVVRDGAANRTVFVEQLTIDGPRLIDAVAVACPTTVLEMQTCRLGPNVVINGSHSDGVQFQAGCKFFDADLLTIYTQYQGLFFGDHDGPIGGGHVTRCNIVGQPGKYLFWRTNPSSYPLAFEDCWMRVEGTPWNPDPAMWVMPDANGSYGHDASYRATYDPVTKAVSWAKGATTGHWAVGTPPGGDFVI